MIPVNRIGKTGVAVIVAATLAACAPNSGNRAAGGALLGAALGGFTGSHIGKGHGKLAAIAIGTFTGAVVGHQIGLSMDRVDRLYAERAAQQALESNQSGEASTWQNPDTGNSGSVTPMRTYAAPTGGPCREFQQVIQVGGRTVQGFGTACRQPDGSWRIVTRS